MELKKVEFFCSSKSQITELQARKCSLFKNKNTKTTSAAAEKMSIIQLLSKQNFRTTTRTHNVQIIVSPSSPSTPTPDEEENVLKAKRVFFVSLHAREIEVSISLYNVVM